jgi:hypothetical protein
MNFCGGVKELNAVHAIAAPVFAGAAVAQSSLSTRFPLRDRRKLLHHKEFQRIDLSRLPHWSAGG